MKRFLFGMVLVVSTFSLFGCGSKARTIKVEECVGATTVSNVKGDTQAYVGQHLENGDYVLVGEDATLLLLLDATKHVFADNGSKFHVVAMYEGKAEKTLVEQTAGTILYGLDKPLKSEDTFMVSTQNVLLAVRGTVFNVEISGDATTLLVNEGTVYTETIENGETVTTFVKAGEQVSFAGTAPAFHDVTFKGTTPSGISKETTPSKSLASASTATTQSPYSHLTTEDVLTDILEWDSAPVPTCVPGECSHLDCPHFYSTGSSYKVGSVKNPSTTVDLAQGRLFEDGEFRDSSVNLRFQMLISQFEGYPEDLSEDDLWTPYPGWYYYDDAAGIYKRCENDAHGGNRYK